MSQLIVLHLGKGTCSDGCAEVTAQLWLSETSPAMQVMGSLPPAPEIVQLYTQWQGFYKALYTYKHWQSRSASEFDIELDDDYPTTVSEPEFVCLCRQIEIQFNQWLKADSFRKIDQFLRTHLSPTDEIRCVISAEAPEVLQLPWGLWQFFEDYPRSELALSLPDYQRSIRIKDTATQTRVRILAILGNSRGIDVTADQTILKQIPDTHIEFLVEPNLEDLHQTLWRSPWDILFFAGHSSSQKHQPNTPERGQLWLNATERLTIHQLRFALKQAIARGLKLAIFNSCDGLGLAWDLADLHLPQVIVMREPVPDRVAQEFLKHFLVTFSAGQPFYLAVRQARERLQSLEADFPCAPWLPVICQNPAEVPPQWTEWLEPQRHATIQPPPSKLLPSGCHLPSPLEGVRVLLMGCIVTSAVMGMRSLGWFQPWELWGFDQLMRSRPVETVDARLLIVAIDEADLQAQSATERRGSLSDDTLYQLMTALIQYQPRAIGLDIYRDFATHSDHAQLANLLQQDERLIFICKSRDTQYDPVGVAPPPEVPEARVGFSDFLEDPDGVLRRHLLFFTPEPASPCTTPYSFSARLAFQYLLAEKIQAEFTADDQLKLDNTVFQRLKDQTGGYKTIDTRGYQILLNYRVVKTPQAIAPQVTLTQVLQGEVNPAMIRDRVILIGVTAISGGDIWSTPYGSGPQEKVPGVFIQAHMTSQLISAVLNQRPLLRVWSWTSETLWVGAWAVVGGLFLAGGRSPLQFLFLGIVGLGILVGTGLFCLTQGIWVPLLPAAVALLSTSGAVLLKLHSRTTKLMHFFSK